jgi:hypothetical protein
MLARIGLQKTIRGVRAIERRVEGRGDAPAEVIRGYGAAVRSALTDDGRPPLEASGLKLRGRLAAIDASLGRAAKKGGAARVAAAAGDRRPGADGDGGLVAGGRSSVRLGTRGGLPALFFERGCPNGSIGTETPAERGYPLRAASRR